MARDAVAFSSAKPVRSRSPEHFSSGGAKPKRLHFASTDEEESRSNVKKSRLSPDPSDSETYGVYMGRPPSPSTKKKPRYGGQQESQYVASRRNPGQSGRGFVHREEGPGLGSRLKVVDLGRGFEEGQGGSGIGSRHRLVDWEGSYGDMRKASSLSGLKRKALEQYDNSDTEELPSAGLSSWMRLKTLPFGVNGFRSPERTTDSSDSDGFTDLPSTARRPPQLKRGPFAVAGAGDPRETIDISDSEDSDSQPSPVRRLSSPHALVGAKGSSKPIEKRRGSLVKRPSQKRAPSSILGATGGELLCRARDCSDSESEDLHSFPAKSLGEQKAATVGSVGKSSRKITTDGRSDSDDLPFSLSRAKMPIQQKRAAAAVDARFAPQTVRRRCCKSLVVGDVKIVPNAYHYLRKEEWASSESDDEREDCRICGKIDDDVMLECDDCLGGFHLRCLNPPLKEVPEGDWFCPACERRKRGETVELDAANRTRRRTARERLLAGELCAVKVLKIWRGLDNRDWVQCRRYIRPEETLQGRRPENGRRELFRTDLIEDIEATRVYRECYIYDPEEFVQYQTCQGADDCFFCGHHYDEKYHTFAKIVDAEEPQPCKMVRSNDSDVDLSSDTPSNFKQRRAKTSKQLKSSKALSKTGKSKLQNPQVTNIRKSSLQKPIKGANKQIVPYGGTAEMVEKRCKPRSVLTEFGEAKSALQLSMTPASLPCRDKERAEITKFLTDAVAAGEKCLGRSLYISGVPGTGKTVLVKEVINAMLMKSKSGKLPKFTFVAINALELQSPEHIFGVLYQTLTGQVEKNKTALELLNKRFSQAKPGKEAIPCVVLVDELDTLVNRHQTELYNLFNWPNLPNSRLVVIGIANTMDLPERMVPRIASRMGQRISFPPYTHTQLQEIITARLDGLQVFDKQALEFASRKVSANTGDARKALKLCTRAVEFAEKRLATSENTVQTSEPGSQGRAKYVGMMDVDAAINDMFQTPIVQMMQSCAKHAKIFLVAMVYEVKRSKMTEITFEKVAEVVRLLCRNNGEVSPDTDTLAMIGSRLGACRLLLAEPSAKHRLQKLQLNCLWEDVSHALREDTEVSWLKKYLE